MEIISLASLSPLLNVAVFVVAASLTWFAGSKLTRYAKIIGDRTGAEQAFVGILLLGSIVSLPEMATTIAAAAIGNAQLAINTLLGGIAMTMVILAVTDAVTGAEPLSTDLTKPIILLEGILVVLFLILAASGIVVGDIHVAGLSVWTGALLALYLLFILLVKRYAKDEPWIAMDDSKASKSRSGRRLTKNDGREPGDRRPTSRIASMSALAALAILVAGVLLAATGEALAEQTGLGASFVGMLLGGIATSLPEVTTTVSAVRLGQYEMAFSDAFGTNLFSVMLLFVADLVYVGGPILNEGGRFSMFGMLLGAALTAIYLAGIVERRHKSIMRMGVDSVLVVITYIGGLVVLFFLRE